MSEWNLQNTNVMTHFEVKTCYDPKITLNIDMSQISITQININIDMSTKFALCIIYWYFNITTLNTTLALGRTNQRNIVLVKKYLKLKTDMDISRLWKLP